MARRSYFTEPSSSGASISPRAPVLRAGWLEAPKASAEMFPGVEMAPSASPRAGRRSPVANSGALRVLSALHLPGDRSSRVLARKAARQGDLHALRSILTSSGSLQLGGSEESVSVHPSSTRGYGGRMVAHEAQDGQGSRNPSTRFAVLRALLRMPSDVVSGEEVVVGRTCPLLGLYCNSVVTCLAVFARKVVDGLASPGDPPQPDCEQRVYVHCSRDAQQLEAEGYEICAELTAFKSMPWGSTEVLINQAALRPVRAEVRASFKLAALASTFWIVGLPMLLDWHLLVVPSRSMEPTILKGDVVAVKQLHTRSHRIDRSDIVAFRAPPALVRMAADNGDHISPQQLFVKRVQGVEGDTVEASDGVLSRNGEQTAPREECDTCSAAHYTMEKQLVGKGEVVVLGDNRGASNDSHTWGMLPRSNITGKVMFRVAPLRRLGKL